MKLRGLDRLTTYIDSTTLTTFPQSLIILGEEGSGKRVLAGYISYHLNLNLVDITDDLSDELIASIYRNPIPQLYMIDVRNIPVKKQDIFLKLLEEPGVAYVIVIANNKFQLLNTILNRAVVLEMPKYSKKCLLEIARDNNINLSNSDINVLRTPGDVLKIYSNNIDINETSELVDKIITKMSKASFPNMLSIVDKFNYKDEYDKLDPDIFLRVLYSKLVENYQNNKDYKNYKIIQEVGACMRKINFDARLNKKYLLTDLLIDIWRISRE